MESSELRRIYGDAPEAAGSPSAPPGLASRDVAELMRSLFWPSLLSATLACLAALQGLATA